MRFDVYVYLKNGWWYVFHMESDSQAIAQAHAAMYAVGKHGDDVERIDVTPMYEGNDDVPNEGW